MNKNRYFRGFTHTHTDGDDKQGEGNYFFIVRHWGSAFVDRRVHFTGEATLCHKVAKRITYHRNQQETSILVTGH